MVAGAEKRDAAIHILRADRLPTKVQIAEAVIQEQEQEGEFEGEVDDGLWVGMGLVMRRETSVARTESK